MIRRYNIFKNGKKINFICDNDKLLKKYEEVFKDISNKVDKEFHNEPTNENDFGIHIKSEVHEKRTYFHGDKAPEKDTDYRCSALIKIESVYFKLKEILSSGIFKQM